jgi:hypothetical protein
MFLSLREDKVFNYRFAKSPLLFFVAAGFFVIQRFY